MHLLIHDHKFRPAHPALAQTEYAGYAIRHRTRQDEVLVRTVAAQVIGRAHQVFGSRVRDWRHRNINSDTISEQRAHSRQVATFHTLLRLQDRLHSAEASVRHLVTSLDPQVWHLLHHDEEKRSLITQLDHELLDAVHLLHDAVQLMDFSMLHHERRSSAEECLRPIAGIHKALEHRSALFNPSGMRLIPA